MTEHSDWVECRAAVEQWFKWDQNDISKKEIEKLFMENKFGELHERLCKRLNFGTAGLRGEMKAGFGHMNDLTIIQTTQGLVSYVLKCFPDATERGVVVGFDGRHNSYKWARITANIFLRKNIPVYLFPKVCPTPFVPYTLSKKKCVCGVMVTASHNPKHDNGYKVYWSNGAQIKSPVDRGVTTGIDHNLEPWAGSWDLSIVDSSPLVSNPLDEVMKSYYEDMQHLNAKEFLSGIPLSSYPKFVYTPVHGVGLHYAEAAFKAFGLPAFTSVTEQADPNPDFPTVKYPNPEEGPDTLQLSFKTAEAVGASVVVANDPDADRFAAAEKLSNGWRVFSGNQLGSLLGYWCWLVFKKANPDIKPSDVYMLHSTVSTKMLQSIAKVEGFNVEETLTGFKWMGNRAHELMQDPEKKVIFAFEEAIGFMCGTEVLDKDGVSALAVGGQMIIYAYAKFGSLSGMLDDLYAKFGYHHSINSYFICHDAKTINAIFDEIRYYNLQNGKSNGNSNGIVANGFEKDIPDVSYPDACGDTKMVSVRDLTIGYDNLRPDNIPNLPVSKSTQMITFTFDNGTTATLRTSGTEPKIKYYTELAGKPGQSALEVKKALESFVDALIKDYLQPEKFGLTSS